METLSYPTIFNKGHEVSETGMVIRNARIFAVGKYPDKGLEVTTEDLDKLVESFQPQPVGFSVKEDVFNHNAQEATAFNAPINIEHMKTPLDGHIGSLTKVWRDGDYLMGTCEIPKFISDVIDKTGNSSVSIEVNRDFSAIKALAMTMTPRVATAAIFNTVGDSLVQNRASLEDVSAMLSALFGREAVTMPDTKPETKTGETNVVTMSATELDALKATAAKATDLEVKFNAAQAEARKERAFSRYDSLLRAGKVVPAQKDSMIAILSADTESVKFSDGTDLSVAFNAFLDAAPVAVDFSVIGKPDSESKVIRFSNMTEWNEASAEDKANAVKEYQKTNGISSFFEADEKLRAEISKGGK